MSFLRSLGSSSRLFTPARHLSARSYAAGAASGLGDLLDLPGMSTSSPSSSSSSSSSSPSPANPSGPLSTPAYNARISSDPARNAQMIEEELSAGRAPTRQNDDSWWHALNNRSSGPYQSRNATAAAIPGNQYSGRSISTTKGPWEVMNAFRQLGGRLARSGLKADVRRSEYHEKPSEKKRRLASERHRRRFQEMVREKVQTVSMIRNRG